MTIEQRSHGIYVSAVLGLAGRAAAVVSLTPSFLSGWQVKLATVNISTTSISEHYYKAGHFRMKESCWSSLMV